MNGLSMRQWPDRVHRLVRKSGYGFLDLLDVITGRRDPMIPPRRLAFLYGYDPEFRIVGEQFLQYFIELGGLKPHERVLDIGCGIGRCALPLTHYLSGPGAYRGFDLIPQGVAWCQQHITPRYPHFRFEQADLYNPTYYPQGRQAAAQYVFPYETGLFDFAFSKSVFTHMPPAEIERYLAECARVLKPGGRCLHTFFILNDESRALMGQGKSAFDFRHDLGGYLSISRAEPEMAVAFEEGRVRAMFAKAGLEITDPIRYGSWCGRDTFLSGQDIVLAIKRT